VRAKLAIPFKFTESKNYVFPSDKFKTKSDRSTLFHHRYPHFPSQNRFRCQAFSSWRPILLLPLMHFKKREELKHKFQGAHHRACSKNLKTRGTSGAAITAVFVNKEAARNLAANRAAIANKRSRKRKKTFAFLRNAQLSYDYY
jgi:hypothetical protein